VISPSQGLYLHRTTQHRKTWTNIHALSGIRTHDPSNQPAKTHASDCTATVTGKTKYHSPTIYIKFLKQMDANFLCKYTKYSADFQFPANFSKGKIPSN
jgi:hypothetical protein